MGGCRARALFLPLLLELDLLIRGHADSGGSDLELVAIKGEFPRMVDANRDMSVNRVTGNNRLGEWVILGEDLHKIAGDQRLQCRAKLG